MRFSEFLRKIANLFKNRGGDKKAGEKKKDYSIRTVEFRFSDVPRSIYLVIKKYGWIVFFQKSAVILKEYPYRKKFTYLKGRTKGFFQKYSKKIKYPVVAAVATIEKEGLRSAAKRSLNFVLYGKGVLDKKKIIQPHQNDTSDAAIYCLTGDGIRKNDVLAQIENLLVNSKDEHILLISHDASASGAPILTSHIAKVLTRNFGKKIIIVTIKGGPFESEFEKFGMVINLNQVSLNKLDKKNEIDSIFRAINSHGVEKCVCNSVVSGILVPFLNKNNFDFVNLIHEQASSIRSCGLADALNHILKDSKKIVFSSEFVKNEFIQKYDHELAGAIVRPQGLFQRNRLCKSKELARQLLGKKINLPENSKIVLGAGYADMRKGVDLFYKVAKKTKERGDKNSEFVWLGDWDENIFKKLKETAVREGYADKVHWNGFEKDPSVFFAGADAFLLTSREDPLPSVALMAMDCRVPVIAFDKTGGIPELLKGGAGISVPKLDADAMAKELINLLADERRQASISASAKEIIESKFDFAEYVKFLLNLFDEKSDSEYSAVPGSDLKVSVIVPNYNYEKFLEERLYSIIVQTHQPFEIIFLDDASGDKSVELAEKFLSQADIPYKIIKNETNAGCFKQWGRGVRESSGDLIWIAEADDSCEPELLEELAAKFADPEVGLAFSQSLRINEFGKGAKTYLPYLEEIPGSGGRWRKDFVGSGEDEIRSYLAIKNTIVNASAVLMRRNLLVEIGENIGDGLSQAGDWMTYVRILAKSKIAFVTAPLNHHRFHSRTIVSRAGEKNEKKVMQLIDETLFVHKFILTNFKLNRRRIALAREHVKLIFRDSLKKELDTIPEYKEKLEIYKKAALISEKSILFFSTNDGWGGSEVACAKMAQSFSSAGWRVALVMKKHTPRPNLLEAIAESKSIEFFERGEQDFCQAEETSRFVDGFDPDIIYISQGHAFEGAELMQWCRDKGLPYVNFIPLVTEYHTKFLRDEKIVEENGNLLRQSKKIFLDNESAQSEMRKIFKTDFENLQVIRNGFDVNYHREFTWNEPKGDEYKLAFIGRLEKMHKGLDMLLKVLLMDKWKKRPLRILIFGHGPYEEVIKRAIMNHNLGNIVLCGYANDLEKAILEVHGTIFPSRMEGTPISLVDGLLCYRMSIVTPVGGMPEMITDGVNGFVAGSVSSKGIDECLERAWQKREKWRDLGKKAGEMAREMVPEFPHQKCIEEVEKIIDEKL